MVRKAPLLIFFVILSACGLERLVYLAPINKDDVVPLSTGALGFGFEFVHNVENDIDEFLGYEIFYKFYSSGSAEIVSDRIGLEDKYIATENTIRNLKFQPILKTIETNRRRPLIGFIEDGSPYKNRKSTPFVFTVDFRGLNDPLPSEPVLTARNPSGAVVDEFPLRRITNPNRPNDLKKFLPSAEEFQIGDPDISGLPRSVFNPGGSLALSICVVAYGRASDFSVIYSEVVFLNRTSDDAITITF